MSAIKLYTSKTDAFYFKDSQRNRFYEFGGIQLLPYNYYLQPYTYSNTITKVESFRLRDDVLLNDLSLYIQATVGYGVKFSRNTVMLYDYGNELIYLRFTHSGGYFYSNPFYYTALDEDKTSLIGYRDNFVDDLYYVSLKVWFRQKSRQSELTTYYETNTKNTVTQAVKSHDLDMYESEFMSMEDLIMTTDILESPLLVINGSVCSLFEAVKLPDLTQQENFGKIKFIINHSIITSGLVLNLDAGNSFSYSGSGTLWNDLSKYGNDGTLINSPAFNSANKGGIVFDGTDDYVSISDTTILRPTVFTLDVWIKPTSFTNLNSTLIVKPYNGSPWLTPFLSYMIRINNYGTVLQCATNNGAYCPLNVNYSFSTGTIYNIVYTYDSSTGVAIAYLNGNQIGTTTFTSGNILYSNLPVILGSSGGYVSTGGTINEEFLGTIYNVNIYNKFLSSTEILENFNSTKSRYGL